MTCLLHKPKAGRLLFECGVGKDTEGKPPPPPLRAVDADFVTARTLVLRANISTILRGCYILFDQLAEVLAMASDRKKLFLVSLSLPLPFTRRSTSLRVSGDGECE